AFAVRPMTFPSVSVSSSAAPLLMIVPLPSSTLFPYTTLFRSRRGRARHHSRALSDRWRGGDRQAGQGRVLRDRNGRRAAASRHRSEEHTSELQSHLNLVCRLLLEKKKKSLSRAHVP